MEKDNFMERKERAVVIYKISSLNDFVVVTALSTIGLVAGTAVRDSWVPL